VLHRQVVDEGGAAPDDRFSFLEEEELRIAVVKYGVFLRVELRPLLRAEGGDPVGIIAIKMVGELDEFSEIPTGLDVLDNHQNNS
jgi:hypothetical protein